MRRVMVLLLFWGGLGLLAIGSSSILLDNIYAQEDDDDDNTFQDEETEFSEAETSPEDAMEEREYVGYDECRSCHGRLARAFSETGHALALQDVSNPETKSLILADFSQGDELRIVLFPGEDAARAFTSEDIIYAIGSGKHVQRYVYALEDETYQVFPAEWNTIDQVWQPFKMADNWPDPAYDFGTNCAACHTSGFDVKKRQWEEPGVLCESCHGLGSEHVEAGDDVGEIEDEETRDKIESTINLALDAQVCGRCHNRGTAADGLHPYPTDYVVGGNLLVNYSLVTQDDPVHWWSTGHASQPNMQFNEWLTSAHASAYETTTASSYFQEACLNCHNVAYRRMERIIEEEGEEDWFDPVHAAQKDPFGVTCATCHNPHTQEETVSYLADDPYDLCTSCHQNTSLTEGLHHPVWEMFEGRQLVESVEGIPSAHFQEEDGPRCVTCHMPQVPVGSFRLASHTFSPILPGSGENDLPSTCSECHTDLTPTDLQSLVEDTQRTVRERLSIAWARVATVEQPEPETEEAQLYQQVVIALTFVQNDGSQGVHNYAYADALLDAVSSMLAQLSVPGANLQPTEAPAPTAIPSNPEAVAVSNKSIIPTGFRPITFIIIGSVLFILFAGGIVFWRASKRQVSTLLLISGLLIGLGFGLPMVSRAAPVDQISEEEGETPPPASDAYCLLCHSRPDQVWELPSGESLLVTIDPSILAQSVHGDENPEGALACADCHGDFRFPHAPSSSRTLREFRLERYAACRGCHEDQYTRAQDSVHGAAMRSGRIEAAVCVDCHGGHDIQPPDEPRQRISLTCGRCHGVIFEEYQNSVHGSGLLDENNPDVPTCIDCHGVHDIQNPTSALFRVRSPELCATCHANETLMSTYNISTQVFDSYLTDFHGSTVTLFEHQTPGTHTNKAVCYDCHGVHNIRAVDGEEGQAAIRETLLETCQQCHPGATANFPDAWIGHYPATPERHPVLFAANRLYDVLTPAVLGVMGLLFVPPLFQRIRQRITVKRG